uniref:Peptidyl-prolyl cis-trans isomerase (PPIase) (EC) n=1 Tax=Ganoderma boninense TaxID=34458 RepID=A0A5K1K191_9APHY|nr:Peptidyl-prolyl cis-trans isomerase (PPIase) (EC [Ganoderma boninense]
MMSRLMLNLHTSALGHNELASARVPGMGSTSESTDNSTSLLFTSRISMPHTPSSAGDPYASRLDREAAYIHDLYARDGRYVEEMHELADYRGGADSDQGAFLRMPVPTHGGAAGAGGEEFAKAIVGGRDSVRYG